MKKKRLGTGLKVLSIVLVVLLSLPAGIFNAFDNSSQSKGESEHITLTLSQEEVLQALEQVGGATVREELAQTEGEEQAVPASIASATLETTEVSVQGQDIRITNPQGEEITTDSLLPEIPAQSYQLDRQLERFVETLLIPENSTLLQQEFMDSLEALWFIKAFTGEGYDALAMFNPDTLQVEIFFLNSSQENTAFTLKVVDKEGNLIEVKEGSASLQKAVPAHLSGEELKDYQSSNRQLEVHSATVDTQEKQEIQQQPAPVESSEEESFAEESQDITDQKEEDTAIPPVISQEPAEPSQEEPSQETSLSDTQQETSDQEEFSVVIEQEKEAEEETPSALVSAALEISEESDTPEQPALPLEEESQEQPEISEELEETEETQELDNLEETHEQELPVDTEQEPEQEQEQVQEEVVPVTPEVEPEPEQETIVEVDGVLLETEEVSVHGEPTQAPRYTVPESTLFHGHFGGIVPFSINYTVTYFIGDTIYKGPITVAQGSVLEQEGVPPQQDWPANTTTFNGWYLRGTEERYDFSTPVHSFLYLEARFSNYYTVTFRYDGGDVIDTKDFAPTAPVTVTDKEIKVPDDSQLSHWYLEGDPEKTPYVFGGTINQDITLCPYFSNQLYVVFVSEGSQIPDKQNPAVVTTGQKVAQPDNPTREGYDFSHWTLEPPAGDESDAGRPAYDFSQPVEENLILYTVWKAKQVDYKVIIWVEKPNVVFDEDSTSESYNPKKDITNYAFAADLDKKALAGEKVDLKESDIAAQVEALLSTSAMRMNALSFSEFSFSETQDMGGKTIAGNGSTVINVYYTRIEYTFNFNANGNESNVKGTLITGDQKIPFDTNNKDTDFSIQWKYQQNIAADWPTVIKADGVSRSFYGWSISNSKESGTTHVSKRYTITENMLAINPRSVKTLEVIARWESSLTKYDLKYWLEPYEGMNITTEIKEYKGKKYVLKEEYSQIAYSSGSLTNKELDGFTANGYETSTNAERGAYTDFFYLRNKATLSFNTQGGNSIAPVGNIPFDMPLKGKMPADPIRKGYAFEGWYLDANFKDVFDVETARMPKDGLTIYAKWRSTAYTIEFYDRYGEGKELIYTTTAGLNETLDFTSAPYQPGQMVPGKGEFNNWFWIVGGNTFISYPQDMPVSKHLTLYATWKTCGFQVTYEQGRGSGTPPKEVKTYDIGSNVALKHPEELVPPTGEVYYGWKVKGGSERLYFPRNLYTVEGTTAFVAQYGSADNAYKLTFLPGFEGSTEEPLVWYVPKNSEVYLADDIYSRENAILIGWSEREGDTTATYSLSELTEISKDMTLYGVWSISSFDVHFVTDPDKGYFIQSGSETDHIVYDKITAGSVWSQVIQEIPTPIAKAGYYFSHWSPELPEEHSQIHADATYTAVFEEFKELTITTSSTSKVYDGTALTDSNFTHSVISDDYKVTVTMAAQATITNVGTTANTVESYQVIRKATGDDVTSEFTVTVEEGSLTVTKREITVRAVNATETFTGSTISVTTAGTLVGGTLASGQTLSALGKGTGVDAGTYDILLEQVNVTAGATDVTENYTIHREKGTLTIIQSSTGMEVNADAVSTVYDGNPHALQVKVTGASGYTVKYSTSATGPFTETHPVITNVSDSKPVYYQVSHPNFVTVSGSARVDITKRPLTLKAADATRTYTGTPITVLVDTSILSGELIQGQTLNATASGVGTNAGSYPITITNATVLAGNRDVTANYSITKEKGTLTVEKRSGVMTGKANGVKVQYDGTSHQISVTVSGATNAVVEYSTSAAGPYGTHPVIETVADSKEVYYQVTHQNYTTVTGSAAVTITKRPITIKADDVTKQYTGGLVEVSGQAPLVSGSLATGQMLKTTTAGSGTTIGTHAIQVTAATVLKGTADVTENYSITKKTGVLTITQRTGVMTATAAPISAVYSGEEHKIAVTVTGATGYQIEYATHASGPFTADNPSFKNVADSGTVYYRVTHPTEATVQGSTTVTISKCNISIKANDVRIQYLGAYRLQAQVTGVPALGDKPVYTLSVTGEDVGTYPIIVSLGDNPNYAITKTDGALVISPLRVSVILPNLEKNAGEADPVYGEYLSATPRIPEGDLEYIKSKISFTRQNGETPNKRYIVKLELDPSYNNPNYTIRLVNGSLYILGSGGWD